MTDFACLAKCEFCDKRGLPVFGVRYAIAPNEGGAPKLTAPLDVKDADGKAIELGGDAHYTTRLLRSGYLYVFDEARKRWEAYFITSEAYFMRFDIGQPLPVAYAGKAPCMDVGHREIASCITIADPKNATKVWFGFSDAEWTPAVLKKHEDANYRKRHMQMLDVAAALAGKSQPHTAKITELGNVVAEYALESAAGAKAFRGTTYLARKAQRESVIRHVDAVRPGKGVILALHDPAGMAAEIGALMNVRTTDFGNRKEYKHPLAVSSAILSLQKAIRHQAELNEIAAAEQLEAQMMAESPTLALTESGRRTLERMRTVTPEELDRAALRSWEKYEEKYNEKKRKDVEDNFNKAFEQYDKEKIAPLAQAHAAWMKSDRLAAYFACNYDPAHGESGVVYTETVSMCIGATQDKQSCFELYSEWFLGEVTDNRNLLLRGLLLNQDKAAEIIAKGSTNATDPRTLPWDAMIGNVDKTFGTVLDNRPDFVGQLMMKTFGALARTARKFAESGALPQALVAAGVVNRTPILRIPTTGTLKQFQAAVVKQIIEVRGEGANVRGLKKAVNDELKRLQIRGGKLAGSRQKSFLVLVDLDALNAVSTAGRKSEVAKALSKTIFNPADLDTLELGRWRLALHRGATVTRGAGATVGRGMPFVFGALGGALQLVAMNALSEELDKATAGGKGVGMAYSKYVASNAAIIGTIADLASKSMEKIPDSVLRFGRGAVRSAGKALGLIAKTLGILGAGIMAVCDWQNANEAISKGQVGLAWAYRLSAALGLSGALLMLSTAALASGIGLILVLLAIGISFLIDAIKDNPIQEWLEDGHYNKNTFPSPEAELEKLKAITA